MGWPDIYLSFDQHNDLSRAKRIRKTWIYKGGTARDLQPRGWLTKRFQRQQPLPGPRRIQSIDKPADTRITNHTRNRISHNIACSQATVVLIGAQTANNDAVVHSIIRAHQLEKPMIGITVHKIKDSAGRTTKPGTNPFDLMYIGQEGGKRYLSACYPTYDWIRHGGYVHMIEWVRKAIADANLRCLQLGRYY